MHVYTSMSIIMFIVIISSNSNNNNNNNNSSSSIVIIRACLSSIITINDRMCVYIYIYMHTNVLLDARHGSAWCANQHTMRGHGKIII